MVNTAHQGHNRCDAERAARTARKCFERPRWER